MKSDHILVFSCPHIPFEHRHFLDFLLDTRDRFKCGKIVCLGDLIDNHAINFWEHNPDGLSPENEMKEADKHLKEWFKAIPELDLTLGNHDKMVDRKNRHVGLPKRCYQPFRQIWSLPKKWHTMHEVTIDRVKYAHGTGYGGKYPHVQAAYDNRQSTVIGHLHSVAGVEWSANSKDCIFGMAVGCGISRKAYTFAYNKNFRRKPILGAGLVTDSGKYAQFVKMEL